MCPPALPKRPAITPTPSPISQLTQYQLTYRLLSAYPDYFWCDPDFYPEAREGAEQTNALSQFAAIQANAAELAAILPQLRLAVKADYTDAEKLAIYREHKKLSQIAVLTPTGVGYNFTLRVGKSQGQTLHGNISREGVINVTTTETSFNTCPICLAEGTLIETPQGAVAVQYLQAGQPVWTQDNLGNRMAAAVLKTARTPVPEGFQILRITLNDGRTLSASPGHPSAAMKALSEYRVGDSLSGGRITQIEPLNYDAGFTYDLLPCGVTGFYWADGILLLSTLTAD